MKVTCYLHGGEEGDVEEHLKDNGVPSAILKKATDNIHSAFYEIGLDVTLDENTGDILDIKVSEWTKESWNRKLK